MSIFQKIKLAWKGREIIGQVTNAPNGWKTLGFWVTLLGSIVGYMAALKEIIPPVWSLIITSVLTAIYQVLRGVEKGQMSGVRPFYRTSEFWLNLCAQSQNAMVTIQTGGVSTDALVRANGILSVVMAAATQFATVPPAPATPEPAKT